MNYICAIIFQKVCKILDANVAQLAEQRFRKPQVKGSSPFIGFYEV